MTVLFSSVCDAVDQYSDQCNYYNDNGETLKVFVGQFLNEYDDIRYHALKCVKVLISSWLADPTAATATGLQRLVATLLTL